MDSVIPRVVYKLKSTSLFQNNDIYSIYYLYIYLPTIKLVREIKVCINVITST